MRNIATGTTMVAPIAIVHPTVNIKTSFTQDKRAKPRNKVNNGVLVVLTSSC